MPPEKKTNTIKFILDTSIYSQEAIISVCYRFVDSAYIFLDQLKAGKILVSIKSKKGISAKQLQLIKDQFFNELLFIAERLNAARRNKKIREFIVGRALFSAIEPTDDSDDFGSFKDDEELDDPLGIAIPWDEKNQKK